MSAATVTELGTATESTDDLIRERVDGALFAVPPLPPGHHETVRASVRDGVVLLLGRVEWRSGLTKFDDLVRAVPGVVEVQNRIGYVFDDRTAPVHWWSTRNRR
jgi:osmotically-inducible protein OsmY